MHKDWTSGAQDSMSASHEKPKKEIHKIEHEKSHNGDHIFTHHHTHPAHHPAETHTKRGDDEMVEHMLQHAGTPNPGEGQDADATPSASPADAAGAPAGAAPAAGAAAPIAGM